MKSRGVSFLVGALLLFGAYTLFFKPEKLWTGYVYANKNDLTTHQISGYFKTLEQCRSGSVARLQEISTLEKGSYECGLACGVRDDMAGLNVCEQTAR